MMSDPLQTARQRALSTLLAARNARGHWGGRLSSSALSTATAVCALATVNRSDSSDPLAAAVEGGLAWLAGHQNADGGWGDTERSFSNLSTTLLAWAAFGAAGEEARWDAPVAAAEAWLRCAVGSLEPERLAEALAARYGKDRTFSIPILTLCAIAGRLGSPEQAWRLVPGLPFELAALPARWFGALRLPVVSYALPALIAIGQVRHHFRPTRNPLLRRLRTAARAPTLRTLERIQPGNGGFLEATPLTAFVTMSLATMGLGRHPVAARGVRFLCASARPDGSWPIDTNLATWLTTLAVQALGGVEGAFPIAGAPAVRAWLLGQQGQTIHPYTQAAPGGWAWTDLPGGVPDADDTAGALLALRRLGPPDEAGLRAAAAGVRWLLDLQNRDGGVPTFCRGWGTLPFDRSSPDITAHALRAWAEWGPELPPALGRRTRRAIRRGVAFLAASRRPDGAWIPLWFGHQESARGENPLYGTARVLLALRRLTALEEAEPLAAQAEAWLVAGQNRDGGWAGAAQATSSVEETGLALEALAANPAPGPQAAEALCRGAAWLAARVNAEPWPPAPEPIGFYFAQLWYSEALYPAIFAAAALQALGGRKEPLTMEVEIEKESACG